MELVKNSIRIFIAFVSTFSFAVQNNPMRGHTSSKVSQYLLLQSIKELNKKFAYALSNTQDAADELKQFNGMEESLSEFTYAFNIHGRTLKMAVYLQSSPNYCVRVPLESAQQKILRAIISKITNKSFNIKKLHLVFFEQAVAISAQDHLHDSHGRLSNDGTTAIVYMPVIMDASPYQHLLSHLRIVMNPDTVSLLRAKAITSHYLSIIVKSIDNKTELFRFFAGSLSHELGNIAEINSVKLQKKIKVLYFFYKLRMFDFFYTLRRLKLGLIFTGDYSKKIIAIHDFVGLVDSKYTNTLLNRIKQSMNADSYILHKSVRKTMAFSLYLLWANSDNKKLTQLLARAFVLFPKELLPADQRSVALVLRSLVGSMAIVDPRLICHES